MGESLLASSKTMRIRIPYPLKITMINDHSTMIVKAVTTVFAIHPCMGNTVVFTRSINNPKALLAV